MDRRDPAFPEILFLLYTCIPSMSCSSFVQRSRYNHLAGLRPGPGRCSIRFCCTVRGRDRIPGTLPGN